MLSNELSKQYLPKEKHSTINGVVFELILTYLLHRILFYHYVEKQSFEQADFSRWLPHLPWTAVFNYFPSMGFKI